MPYHPRQDPEYTAPLSSSALDRVFSECGDYESREVLAGLWGGEKVTVCWIDGVVSGTGISEDVIRPLTESRRLRWAATPAECARLIERGAVYSYSVKRRLTLSQTAEDLVRGFCAVIFDSIGLALTFEVRTANSRGVSQPTTEKTLKGAKDAFVETLRVNTSLVRRKLRTARLKETETVIGRKSGTAAAVMYVKDVADPRRVEEVLRRLDAIDIDGLVASGDLEEYLSDAPSTPFPQLLHTERPDRFASALLQGRVGVIADGLPIGFMLPATLASFMRVPEDDALHFSVSSMLSLFRWIALLFSLTLPAVLVAVALYHQEMIPTQLLISMVAAKQGVPFGVALEVLSMLVAFELLQEAGLRLPDPVGQTISIIGALIVGQSAVDARVVSPVAVIVVALAGICGYTLPSQDLSGAIRLCRFLLLVLAVALGMFGVAAGLAMLTWHLCTVESFGLAYTWPLTDAPFGMFKAVFRRPLRSDKLRDPKVSGPDRRRQR